MKIQTVAGHKELERLPTLVLGCSLSTSHTAGWMCYWRLRSPPRARPRVMATVVPNWAPFPGQPGLGDGTRKCQLWRGARTWAVDSSQTGAANLQSLEDGGQSDSPSERGAWRVPCPCYRY